MKIQKPNTNHFSDFQIYRSRNLGYDDSFDPKICWDFYSKKVGAEWIDNEAFCIGIYPFMDGHAFGFFELKSKDKNLQQNQWKNIKKNIIVNFMAPLMDLAFYRISLFLNQIKVQFLKANGIPLEKLLNS